MTVDGTVVFEDLEMGTWFLETADGTRYVLAGGDRGLKREGQRLRVEGEIRSDTVSFQMAGPLLHVIRYEVLPDA